MIKKLPILAFLIINGFYFSQVVSFEKVVKTHFNQDRFFYRIDANQPDKELLAELSIDGFSTDDEEVFAKIYKKAKEVGANSFSFIPNENIDGSKQDFNPHFYKLALYYTPASKIDDQNNEVYFINPSQKTVKISFDNQLIVIPVRQYFKYHLENSKVYSASTRKFLGSGLNLSGQENQPEQFFFVIGSKIKANPYGTAGINFKTGDFIPVERSYGDFLSIIYQEIQPEK